MRVHPSPTGLVESSSQQTKTQLINCGFGHSGEQDEAEVTETVIRELADLQESYED